MTFFFKMSLNSEFPSVEGSHYFKLRDAIKDMLLGVSASAKCYHVVTLTISTLDNVIFKVSFLPSTVSPYLELSLLEPAGST